MEEVYHLYSFPFRTFEYVPSEPRYKLLRKIPQEKLQRESEYPVDDGFSQLWRQLWVVLGLNNKKLDAFPKIDAPNRGGKKCSHTRLPKHDEKPSQKDLNLFSHFLFSPREIEVDTTTHLLLLRLTDTYIFKGRKKYNATQLS